MKKILYLALLIPCMAASLKAMYSPAGGEVRQVAGGASGQTMPAYRGVGAEQAARDSEGGEEVYTAPTESTPTFKGGSYSRPAAAASYQGIESEGADLDGGDYNVEGGDPIIGQHRERSRQQQGMRPGHKKSELPSESERWKMGGHRRPSAAASYEGIESEGSDCEGSDIYTNPQHSQPTFKGGEWSRPAAAASYDGTDFEGSDLDVLPTTRMQTQDRTFKGRGSSRPAAAASYDGIEGSDCEGNDGSISQQPSTPTFKGGGWSRPAAAASYEGIEGSNFDGPSSSSPVQQPSTPTFKGGEWSRPAAAASYEGIEGSDVDENPTSTQPGSSWRFGGSSRPAAAASYEAKMREEAVEKKHRTHHPVSK